MTTGNRRAGNGVSKGMRNRLAVLAPVSVLALGCLLAAGCGTAGSSAPSGGASTAATSRAAAASAPASSPPSAGPASTGPASAGPASMSASAGAGGNASGTGSCPAAKPAMAAATGALTGVQFVSATRGWAVGQNALLATTDGGAHWTAQLPGARNLTSVDFVSARDGWAVGTTALYATTDGGAHWTARPEPCPAIRSVHFLSPTAGYAVAGSPGVSAAGPEVPVTGGTLLATSDGGKSWHSVTAPAGVQSACFSDPAHGWLGAGGLLYRTTDGGRDWAKLTGTTWASGNAPALMNVECASGGSAWALSVGPDAGMSQQEHIAYHAGPAGATAIYAEQYFPHPGVTAKAGSPSVYAGPFSALSPTSAVFVDWCDACGYGTAPWDVATSSGTVLTKQGTVGSVSQATAASFLSAQAGWVTGSFTQAQSGTAGKTRVQQRIVATSDGGRTWRVQYAGPWGPWSG